MDIKKVEKPDSEEKTLQEKLESLENKYKQMLFPKSDSEKSEEFEEGFKKPVEVEEAIESDKRPVEKVIERIEEIPEEKPLRLPFKESVKKSKKIDSKHKGKGKDSRPTQKEVDNFIIRINQMKKEISKVLIGQEEIVDGMILGLLCDGHVLLEGVPGIAKTLAIRALGAVSGCDVKRVQFTVDLLPTDIIGITSYTPEKGFEVIKGPVFANFLIADEINRSPPKTQSALMESMQERQATIGKESLKLPSPFFVMATENPLENAGVYPLPEAQIDRFLFKMIMGYPKADEEKKVMETNMTLKKFEDFNLKKVITPEEIIKMQNITKRIYLDDSIKDYILSIVQKSRNKEFKDSEYLTFGASPRATIAIFIASKAQALMNGRSYVIPEDVKAVVYHVMRHRLILSYKATLKKISPDDLIKNILDEVEVR